MTGTRTPQHDVHHDGPDDLSGHVDDFIESLQPAAPPAEDAAALAVATVSGSYRAGFAGDRDREELALDVDGAHPQMTASGTVVRGLAASVHWIASLTPTASNTWTGGIWYRDGQTGLVPHAVVTITVTPAPQRRATVRFGGTGLPDRVQEFGYVGPAFHPVEFEYDTVEGAGAVLEINTGDHRNRPAALPVERLSIDTVFRRTGFAVTRSGADSPIALAAAGADALWSDMEMHDAMRVHWSRFANRPQWSLWTLFAWQHEPVPELGITPQGLGGIMFDDIGPNHRQGTAIFNGSFIGEPPAGDPQAAAAVRRTKFWTAVHEMGHSFNLAHAWQKSLGTPWIQLSDEPLSRSFMNYPTRVPGGATAFYADFEYRFSDSELLFLRHAPERFVQHGNADWFVDHAFRLANVSPEPALALEVRTHRDVDRFEFLEPVVVELKLTNVSRQPQLVDRGLLTTGDLTVIVARQGAAPRQWTPFARYCVDVDKVVLLPGESMYSPVFVAAGLNGWDLAEPGRYQVQVALHLDEEDVVSNALDVLVAPPLDHAEEVLAQDVLVEDVGRTLALGGTRAMTAANDTLRSVVERMPDRPIADHARLALGNPLARSYKLLDHDQAAIAVLPPDPAEAAALLSGALVDEPGRAADTLGHIDYTRAVERYAAVLVDNGDTAAATKSLRVAEKTLSDRGVLDSVITGLADLRRKIGRS